MRFVRLVTIVCTVFVAIVVVVAALLTQVDLDRFKDEINARIVAATGRACHIDGAISRTGVLNPQISITDLRFGSVPGASNPDMLRVGKAVAHVDLAALLRGAIDIKTLELRDVHLVFERGDNNKPNWRFDNDDEKETSRWFSPLVLLGELSLKDFTFVRKLRSGREFTIGVDHGTMRYDSARDLAKIEAKGRVGTAPTTVNGTVAKVTALAQGEQAPAHFDLSSLSAVGSMDGFIVRPSTGESTEFALKLDDADTGIVRRMLGLPMPVIGAVAGTARLKILGSEVALDDLILQSVDPNFQGRVAGRVGDMKRLADIDLKVALDDGGLVEVLPVLARWLPPSIRAKGTSRLTGDRRDLAVSAADVDFSLGRLLVNARGDVGNARYGTDFALSLSANADTVASLRPFVPKFDPKGLVSDLGALVGEGLLVGDYRSLTLRDVSVSINDSRIKGTATTGAFDVRSRGAEAIDFDLKSDDADGLIQRFGIRLPEASTLVLKGALAGASSSFAARIDAARLQGPGLSATASGDVREIGKTNELRLSVEAGVDELKTLEPIFSKSMPDLNNGFLTGQVEGSVDAPRLSVDLVSIEDERIRVNGSGVVNGFTSKSELDLKLQAESSRTDALGKLFGKEVPDLGATTVNGRLLRSGQRYRLEQIDASSTRAGLAIVANGEIADIAGFVGVDIDIDADARDIESLPFDVSAPSLYSDLGPINVRASLRGEGMALGVDDIKVEVKQDAIRLNVHGEIANLNALDDGRYDIRINAEDLTKFKPYVDWELPKLGPVDVTGELTRKDTGWRIDNLRFALSDPLLNAQVAGTMEIEDGSPNLALDLNFATPSVADLGDALGRDLKYAIPLSGSSSFAVRGDDIDVNDIEINVQEGTVLGELKLRPRTRAGENADHSGYLIDGSLRAESLDLKAVLPEPSKNDVARRTGRYFSSKPFPVDALRRHELNIKLDVDEVKTHKYIVNDIDTRLIMRESTLSLKQRDFGVLGGVADVEFRLQAETALPRLAVFVSARGIDPAKIPSKKLADIVEYGFVNLDLTLSGVGRSMTQVMSTSNGSIELELFNLLVDGRALEVVGSDITLQLLRAVNPFLEKENNVEFECGLFLADVNNGIVTASNTIAAQSNRIALVGGGVIDLGSEKLEVVISPRPRKGIGISASNLARVVRIGGTLASPRLEVDPRGVLQSGAKVGAAIYTGGLTILAEGILNRLRGIDNVCEGVRVERRIRAGEIERVQPANDAVDKR